MKKLLRKSVNLLPASSRSWIKHIPGIAAGQRWLVSNVLSGGPFVHTINAGPASGLHFEIVLPDDKAIWAGIVEPEFSQTLHDFVRKGDVCYDIGGYRGYMSGVMALAGASRVIVFEPLPDNLARLQRLCELNPNLPLQIEEMAVGRTDCETTFLIMPDESMGKIVSSPFQSGRGTAREIPVRLARLDTLVFKRRLPRPNLMKIDAEGTEADVLNGAARTLAECRPRILIEAHSEELSRACEKKLAAIGYKIRQLEKIVTDPLQARHLAAEP